MQTTAARCGMLTNMKIVPEWCEIMVLFMGGEIGERSGSSFHFKCCHALLLVGYGYGYGFKLGLHRYKSRVSYENGSSI